MREVTQIWWAIIIAFAGFYYLTGVFWKSALVAGFVMISCATGLGQQWALRGAFAVAVVTLAVVLGFPGPHEWPQLMREARMVIAASW